MRPQTRLARLPRLWSATCPTPEHRAELGEQVADLFGSLDALFVNVGVAEFEPFSEVTEASWDRHFDVNAKGAFFTAQKLIPLVSPGGGVVFTTVTAATASPGMAVFAATKGAVRAFAHTMAAELVTQNIRVNTVAPGFIDTPTLGIASATPDERAELHQIGDMVTPMKRHGTPEEVAGAAVFLALEATFTTGDRTPSRRRHLRHRRTLAMTSQAPTYHARLP